MYAYTLVSRQVDGILVRRRDLGDRICRLLDDIFGLLPSLSIDDHYWICRRISNDTITMISQDYVHSGDGSAQQVRRG
jgi:hypothetical protein